MPLIELGRGAKAQEGSHDDDKATLDTHAAFFSLRHHLTGPLGQGFTQIRQVLFSNDLDQMHQEALV